MAEGTPRGYWNFSWVAENYLSFPGDSVSGEWDFLSVQLRLMGS